MQSRTSVTFEPATPLPVGSSTVRIGFPVPRARMIDYQCAGELRARLDRTDSKKPIPHRLALLMPASIPSPEGGKRLRAERMRLRLSTRDVERLSRRLAHEKKSQDYYISHAWLTDAENGAFAPGIYKLYSLSIIYKRRYDEILAFFGIDLRDIGREQIWLTLPRTHLIGSRSESPAPAIQIPSALREKIALEKTNLVSRMFNQWGGVPVSLFAGIDNHESVYGYIGTEDFTLFPLIRPGSFVQIDANQTRVDRGRWQNEFDRPIYFIELRNGYACSWCEVREGRLLLVPYPQSSNEVREVRFPGDAGIVGRVTAVSMRIAE
jgi:transcriptional regulator with XRE-family HTH domain